MKRRISLVKGRLSQTLQQPLQHLEFDFRNFFAKRSDYPRFKKKGMRDSFRFSQSFKVEQHNNHISLPKLDWMRYRNSREILGIVKNITLSQKCGKQYASFQTERDVEQVDHPFTNMVGIDVGIVQFVTLSSRQVF